MACGVVDPGWGARDEGRWCSARAKCCSCKGAYGSVPCWMEAALLVFPRSEGAVWSSV